MNNTSLYAPIYDQSVMMHKVVFHDNTDGSCHTREYTYKAAIHLEPADRVIVEARGWYQIATVSEVNVSIPVEDDNTCYKWIVAKVDLNAAADTRQWEQQLIDEINAKRVENMRQQMIAHLGVHPNELTTLMAPESDDGQEE
jgi:hypothetical protein